MAVTKTKLMEYGYSVDRIYAYGSYVYLACNDGRLRQYTIADSTMTDLYSFNERVKAMVGDGTYIYVILASGLVKRYTISGGAVAVLGSAPGVSMMGDDTACASILSGTIYIGCGDGKMYSITTS